MKEAIKDIFKEKRVCVLVPTYNNATTLATVLGSLLSYTDQIIVVNDGSTDNTLSILSRFNNVGIVSYERNQGKGYALRRGFAHAVACGYDYAITIDSDGQHFADDLPRFLAMLDEFPNALIIGARNMDQASVPGKSSFGNQFSNFWFWVETGIKRTDTQSGYRLYPVKALENARFFTRKYEFEIEVIVRAAWSGIDIVEVPVKVFYPEREKRISHFRPFKDFSRISVLNTVLVTIALLYIKPRDFFRSFKKKDFRTVLRELLLDPNESHYTKALSVGFGVFMGIVPLWGFQMLIAITVSIFLKLNKALVILAANISIPPMIPVILYASHFVGKIWMGKNAQSISFSDELTLALIHNNFVQYVLGAVTLSILAGVFSGLITFGILKKTKRNQVAG